MPGKVVAVAMSATHSFSKPPHLVIHLTRGLGVDGDAHRGEKVKHRTLVARDPERPNLRQVHLIHAELFEELAAAGFDVAAGELGENVTTHGIDLLGLPAGARLRFGSGAVIEVTGLRNPCRQIDGFQQGLMAATLGRNADGTLIRKTGVMAVVLESGDIASGDIIEVEAPPEPHQPLPVV
jgi:MOSC domain-containing protein YiiM